MVVAKIKCIFARMKLKGSAILGLMISAVVFCSFSLMDEDPQIIQRYPEVKAYNPEKPDTAVIRILGDIMLHSAQIECDYSTFLADLEEDLRSADVAIGNIELTLAGPPYTGYPAFSSPDSYAEYIQSTGIDIFLTANNHILDKGMNGFTRTLSVYREMEPLYTGSGADAKDFKACNPLYIRAKGIKIALVNATYGANYPQPEGYPRINLLSDMDAVCRQVSDAKNSGADFVIALPHWGTEYRLKHSPEQQEMAVRLAKSGADVIVGAHPHVVQDMGSIRVKEKDGSVRDVPVFYSLGNAVSNMSATNTQVELMVTLTFVRHADGHTEMLDPTWDWLWCTLPGRLCHSYKTVKIEEYIDRKDEWKIQSDYDKMVTSWRRVKNETKIK